jgi:RNA polymerase sigma factor (sigma-70 family)
MPKRNVRSRTRNDDDPLWKFTYVTFSAEEEHELLIKAQQGDVEAQNKLVFSALPWIIRRSTRYHLPGYTVADQVSEGVLACIATIKYMDTTMSTRLVSLLPTAITWHLAKCMQRCRTLLPRQDPFYRQWLKGCPYEGDKALISNARLTHFNEPAYHPDVIAQIDRKAQLEQVFAWAAKYLQPRPLEVFVRRFVHIESMADIAESLGVTRQRVEQIVRKAETELRKAFPQFVKGPPQRYQYLVPVVRRKKRRKGGAKRTSKSRQGATCSVRTAASRVRRKAKTCP